MKLCIGVVESACINVVINNPLAVWLYGYGEDNYDAD